jgi:hypothetical protein
MFFSEAEAGNIEGAKAVADETDNISGKLKGGLIK